MPILEFMSEPGEVARSITEFVTQQDGPESNDNERAERIRDLVGLLKDIPNPPLPEQCVSTLPERLDNNSRLEEMVRLLEAYGLLSSTLARRLAEAYRRNPAIMVSRLKAFAAP